MKDQTVSALKVLAGATPVIAGLVAAAFVFPPQTGHLSRQVLLFAWGISGIIAAEWLLFGPGLPRVLRALGFVRPTSRSIGIALMASLPMWLFLPLYGLATGTPTGLSPHWPVLLTGVILVNGITEEAIHRAFVFGHLRRGSTFLGAATLSGLIFAAQHLYLIFTIGPVAGGASVALAFALAFPLARLFDTGGGSIAGAAILHTSSNAPMLILAPAASVPDLILPHMAIVLVSIYSTFAFRPRNTFPAQSRR